MSSSAASEPLHQSELHQMSGSSELDEAPVYNIAEHLIRQAARAPHRPAVICALSEGAELRRSYTHLTFEQLNAESAHIAAALKASGIARGTRAIVMVRPGPDLFAITFGLFKAGVVPVLIDPGMDRSDLKECIAQAAPELFIGIPLAHLARHILGWGRATVKRTIMVGGARRGVKGALSALLTRLLAREHLDDLKQGVTTPPSPDYLDERDPDAIAAILYTSGSTGAPKGAVYHHRHFAAQVELLKTLYPFREGAFDVPTFPLFALFDPALGMSAVFPQMDYSAPATANPDEVFAAINDFGAENLFCSPALLRVLAAAIEPGVARRLPTMRRVISAGAPVPPVEMRRLLEACHPEAEIFTPYGATESLPLTSISCAEVSARGEAGQRVGRGVCVGRPPAGVELRLIEVTDDPIPTWDEASLITHRLSEEDALTPESAARLVGEVVVYAPSTTQSYLGRPDGDRASKITGEPPSATPLEGQRVSHRMGDLGYFDEQGYLWLCGRKSHRVDRASSSGEVTRWLPLCVEGVVNTVDGIKRTALVNHERGPVLCVELSTPSDSTWSEVSAQIKALCESESTLAGVMGWARHPGFPVDTRHNAKIKRERLTEWARGARFTWAD